MPPVCAAYKDGLYCTEWLGHAGDHVASTLSDNVLARWPQQPAAVSQHALNTYQIPSSAFDTYTYYATSSNAPVPSIQMPRHDGQVVLRMASGFELPYQLAEDSENAVVQHADGQIWFQRTNGFDAYGRRVYTEALPEPVPPPVKRRRAIKLGEDV